MVGVVIVWLVGLSFWTLCRMILTFFKRLGLILGGSMLVYVSKEQT